MRKFTSLTSTAAPLLEDNIDTDIIYPARFLLLTAREGLGAYAFHDRRYHVNGSERSDFVLNGKPWRDAQIMVAGANFGCGSSREQAVWALLSAGISCIIAPSFGEIFYGNCFRNGVLAITLPPEQLKELALLAKQGSTITVNLETCCIEPSTGAIITFFISEEKRQALLNGWDETAMMLNTHGQAISDFETEQRRLQPWLYGKTAA